MRELKIIFTIIGILLICLFGYLWYSTSDKLNKTTRDLKGNQSQLDTVTKDRDSLKTQLSSVQSERDSLNQQITTLNQKARRDKNELDSLNSRVNSLNTDSNDLQTKLRDLTKENTDLKAKIAESNNASVSVYAAQVSVLLAERQSLIQKLIEARSYISYDINGVSQVPPDYLDNSDLAIISNISDPLNPSEAQKNAVPIPPVTTGTEIPLSGAPSTTEESSVASPTANGIATTDNAPAGDASTATPLTNDIAPPPADATGTPTDPNTATGVVTDPNATSVAPLTPGTTSETAPVPSTADPGSAPLDPNTTVPPTDPGASSSQIETPANVTPTPGNAITNSDPAMDASPTVQVEPSITSENHQVTGNGSLANEEPSLKKFSFNVNLNMNPDPSAQVINLHNLPPTYGSEIPLYAVPEIKSSTNDSSLNPNNSNDNKTDSAEGSISRYLSQNYPQLWV